MFILETSACMSSSVLAAILFIKKLIKILSIIVPAILVLLLSIDFAKAVIASDDDQIKRAQSLAIKRIIYGLIVFFVPMIVDVTFGLIDSKNVKKSCFSNATDEVVSTLRKAENEKLIETQSEREELIKAAKEDKKTSDTKISELRNKSIISDDSDDSNSLESSVNVNETTSDGIPSCELKYNETTGVLTFSKTQNAAKYAIVKSGKSPSYKNQNILYYPGSDRMDSTKDRVSLNYEGYVKNSNGDAANCSKSISVSRGAAAVEYAKTFMGKKYCYWWNKNRRNWYGQKNLVCTDCSGFTGGIYNHLGISKFSRDDDDQCSSSYSKTFTISGRNSTSNAKVGDIVCFGKKRDNGSINYTHVALFLGKTKDGKVKIIQMGGGHGKVNIDTRKSWVKIVRVNGSN